MKVRVLLVAPRSGARSTGAARAPRRDECAVVVDVLRATTTLTVALGHGARGVEAVATPEEAFARKELEPGALLGGEREGKRIEGFDLGNSPFEYPITAVAQRRLIFASTNGSLALLAAAGAGRRMLGAFVNAQAVVDRLAQEERQVVVVCAGKLGSFALEDVACAGLLCERLVARGARLDGPGASLARAIAPGDAMEVRSMVQGSSHGRYLRSLGPQFARDVEFCGELDALDQAFDV
jgi:2-phosphosulfolactate phosphatase